MSTEACRSPKPHQDGERVWKEIEAQASVLDKSEVWISGLSLSCDDGSACEVEYEVRNQPPYTSRHTPPPGILSSPIASSTFGTRSEGMPAGGGFNWGGPTRPSPKGEAPVSPRPSTAGEGQPPSVAGAPKAFPRQESVEDMRNAVGPTEVLQLWSNLSGGSSSSFGSADACDGTGFSSRAGPGGERLSLSRPPPLAMTYGLEASRVNSTAIMSPIDSPISVASCSSSGSGGASGGAGFQGSRRPVPNACTSFEQVTRQVSVMPFSASSMSQSTVGPSSGYPLTLPLDDDDSWCANVLGYAPMSSSKLTSHSPSQRALGSSSKDWDASSQGNSEGVVTTPRSLFSPGFKDSLQGAAGSSSGYAAGLRSATGRRSGSWVRLEQGGIAAASGPRRPQRTSEILGARALRRADSGKDDSESFSSEVFRRASTENVPSQEFDRHVHRTTSVHSVPDESSWSYLAPLNENASDVEDRVPGHALAGAAAGAGSSAGGSPNKLHGSGSGAASHSTTNFTNPGPVTLSPVPSVYKPMCSWGLLPDVRAARRDKQ